MDSSEALLPQLFQSVDRTLWLVTAAVGNRRGGLVATWVMQASLDDRPGVMLVSIATNHFTCELIDEGQAFGLHLLGPQHVELAVRFATRSGRDADKFEGLAPQLGRTGVPLVADAPSWLECRVIARLSTGDRAYYWGEVINGGTNGGGAVLTERSWFQQLDPATLAALQQNRCRDIQIQGPLFERWRQALPEGLRPTGD